MYRALESKTTINSMITRTEFIENRVFQIANYLMSHDVQVIEDSGQQPQRVIHGPEVIFSFAYWTSPNSM